MATVPANSEQTASRRGGGLLPQSDMLAGMSGLSILRQLGLLIGLAASVALGVATVLWAQGTDYRPLYGNLDRLDSAAVLNVLDSNHIKYKLDNNGALLVESDKIDQARLKLAASGVPSDSNAGFQFFDKAEPLGTSQFMETARYRYALEGELARTIASINNVRSARVHLGIPKDSVFVSDQRAASASVFVELYPGASLRASQVKSIVNLVASSIPDLKPQNVTVVDQRGTLLSDMVMDDPQLIAANRQLEYTHRIEQQLRRRINSILTPILGANRFRAEVSADVDFSSSEEAGEQYNPDAPALRSEEREVDRGPGSSGASGIPGALSNEPPATGSAPAQVTGANANQQGQAQGAGTATKSTSTSANNGNMHERVVRNYELDRTLSYTKHPVGTLRRISVAVAVANTMPADAEPGDQGKSLSAAELQRLTILVRNAVGFDPARGDVVNVVSAPFAPLPAEAALPPTPWYKQAWVLSIGKIVGAVLVVVALILFVLRPVMNSLTQGARDSRPLGSGLPGDLGDAMGQMRDDTVTLSGANTNMALPGPENNYDQQLTAIKGLIAEDPGRVAQVVKKWVASSE